MTEPVWAIGLMSGTSIDGIDAALIKTDGVEIFERGPWVMIGYDQMMREALDQATHGQGVIPRIEHHFTLKNAEVVQQLLKQSGMKAEQVSVIGFHGQTILHKPKEGISWQIGNPSLLAAKTGINVVADFRRRDVAEGGEGAPLVPLYHAALARHLALPIAVLNIGGIANVSWINRSEEGVENVMGYDIVAFDTGPGNVLIDEWVRQKTGKDLDMDGTLALKGKADKQIVQYYLEDEYIGKYPPKSLDRHYFSLKPVQHLSIEDGAATLAELTAATVDKATKFFPGPVKHWLVAGGGRMNPAIMNALKQRLGDVKTVEAVGWDGDAIEAQAFGYLAVRSMLGLPLSLPTTTGTNRAVTGGAFYRA